LWVREMKNDQGKRQLKRKNKPKKRAVNAERLSPEKGGNRKRGGEESQKASQILPEPTHRKTSQEGLRAPEKLLGQ